MLYESTLTDVLFDFKYLCFHIERNNNYMFLFSLFSLSISLFIIYSSSFDVSLDIMLSCSHSQTIKVPCSWEAMVKLVEWLYTGQLPDPPNGCLWDNMDSEEKLYQLLPFIELCWLADFWRLEGVQDVSYKVIVSCLDASRELSIKVIQIAAKFSLWKLAEVAAELMAPLYYKLRDSGDLEQLDDFLVDLVRTASVRHCQEITIET